MRRPYSGSGRRRTGGGNGIKGDPRSGSCLGSACSWVRVHPRLGSPCQTSDSCQRDSCWDCLRQAWRRSWAWIEGRSATGSEACGFLPRKGSQRSRHSWRQLVGNRLEFQLLRLANSQGFVAFLSPGPKTLKAGKPMPYPEVPATLRERLRKRAGPGWLGARITSGVIRHAPGSKIRSAAVRS